MNKNIINISKSAIEKFKLLAKQYNYPYVKISIARGGMHGFNYRINYIKNIKNCTVINNNIVLCNKSAMFLDGMNIDYGIKFIFKNPNAKNISNIDNSFNCFHNY